MTIDKKYGTVFRDLRKQRGFKLTSFQENGISPASISNFENGKTRIAFDKLEVLLHIMSITLEEYLTYTDERNDDTIFHHENLIQNIINTIFNDTHSDFETYQLEAIHLQEYFLYLALKGTKSPLKLDELGELSDYLDKIKYWRIADLCTLYLSIDHLKPRQTTYILEGFFMGEGHYSYSAELFFFHIVCHVISSLILTNNQENAKHFINYLSYQNYEHHTMYTRNLLCFIRGYWVAKFENHTKGINQLKNALDIFEKLESPTIAGYYRRLLDKFSKDCSSHSYH